MTDENIKKYICFSGHLQYDGSIIFGNENRTVSGKINYGTVIAEEGNWYLFWHFLDFRFR